jgi:pimeloyl-ACP methyl ester carboxylesterase
MRYFVAHGERRAVRDADREGRRGDFARLTDGVTHYEFTGPRDGPLAVFVPGLTIPLGFWDAVVRMLHTVGIRTLTYSAYGRGRSDRVEATYDRDLFVRQLDELLAQVARTTPVHLVGSSMGALIALAYCRRAGHRVDALTLSGPAGLHRERNPAANLPRRGPLAPLVGRYLLRRGLLRHLAHNVRSADDAARLRALVLEGFEFEGSMYALLSTLMNFPLAEQDELFDNSPGVLPPTMLLWGAEDEVTPISDFGRAVELLHPVQAHVIDECGHMAAFERPAEFACHLARFVPAARAA